MEIIDKFKSFIPQHDFFIGVDSDGCAFDAMGIKHKKAFIPMAIKVWNLQAIEKQVYEVGEFVNLYSGMRGINRFPGLLVMFECLEERLDVAEADVILPNYTELRDFVNSGLPMSNFSLKSFADSKESKFLSELLEWSVGSDQLFSLHVEDLPPFQYVAESLAAAEKSCDLMIVSAASGEGLLKDWKQGGILQYMTLVAGQEVGSKKDQLAYAAQGKYKENHILMIGDAPGDLKAAKDNGALFYPIFPGYEVQSWKRFYEQAFELFVKGEYAGNYEEKLIAEFLKLLPNEKPWVIK